MRLSSSADGVDLNYMSSETLQKIVDAKEVKVLRDNDTEFFNSVVRQFTSLFREKIVTLTQITLPKNEQRLP